MRDPVNRLLFTADGMAELSAEVSGLEEVRQNILCEAQRSSGPSRDSLRDELEVIDEQIRRLQYVLASGSLVENTGFVVAVGSEVTIVDEQGTKKIFSIGGPLAANPHFACVSFESPVARAVLGHQLGDAVEVASGQDRRRWRIVALRGGRSQPDHGQGPLAPITA